MPNGSHILANGCGAINIVRIATIGIDRFTRIARINRINGMEGVNANGRDRWDQRQWMDGRGEKIFFAPTVCPAIVVPSAPAAPTSSPLSTSYLYHQRHELCGQFDPHHPGEEWTGAGGGK